MLINRSSLVAFFIGALVVGLPGYYFSYKWIENEALGAFNLGLASGEAGYVNLFSERIKEGKSVESAVEFSICVSEYNLSLNFDNFKNNEMAAPAYVVVPDAIRNSLEYRKVNGIEKYEDCGNFVKSKYSLDQENT